MSFRSIFRGDGLNITGFDKLGNEPQTGSGETQKIPEAKTGLETAEIVAHLYDVVPPEFRHHLVDSNVVLTLAGYKPFTNFHVDVAPGETHENFLKKLEAINNYFISKDLLIYFRTNRRELHNRQTIMTGNLLGFERQSKTSKLPGVTPFNRSAGWGAFEEWYSKQIGSSVDEWAGFDLGYPDIAIADQEDSLATGRKMVDAKIPLSRLYESANPSFDIYPEHLNDAVVQNYLQEAGKILQDFYSSSWHKSKQQELAFHLSKPLS